MTIPFVIMTVLLGTGAFWLQQARQSLRFLGPDGQEQKGASRSTTDYLIAQSCFGVLLIEEGMWQLAGHILGKAGSLPQFAGPEALNCLMLIAAIVWINRSAPQVTKQSEADHANGGGK